MTRVLTVDDHPALRAGLAAVLRSEPGLVPCGTAADAESALDQLRHGPDVMLVDYELPGRDGLALCADVKARPSPPAVLIYSAHESSRLALPAVLAGADGVVDKSAPAERLLSAIRLAGRGERVFPADLQKLLADSSPQLEASDLPVLSMIAAGSSRTEVAEVMRMDPQELDHRVERMIAVLRPRFVSR